MAKDEIIRTAVEGVKFAKSLCDDIEFSPEDASRTELEFLAEVVEAVVEAGATTVNIPDTVGYTVPQEFHEVFAYLKKHVRGIDKITLVSPLPRRFGDGCRKQPRRSSCRRTTDRMHDQRHR